MASPQTQTYNITQTDLINNGASLVLTLQPQPTNVNGSSLASGYVFTFTINNPTQGQISGYVNGGTIILASNL